MGHIQGVLAGAALGLALLATPAGARAEVPEPNGCPTGSTSLTTAPAGDLRITFLGVSTLLFDDGVSQLLVDGYFTRPGFKDTAFGRIGPKKATLKAQLDLAGVERLRAVLVAHAHHDHAMDAPMIAGLHKEAVIVGGASTVNLGTAAQVAEAQLCTTHDRQTLYFGPFEVEVFKSPHGDTGRLLGWLLTGDTPSTRTLPAHFRKLKDTENFSYRIRHGGREILVHPSADVTPGAYAGSTAQIVFLGAGRLGKQSQEEITTYWRQVGGAVGASTVVPVHWDNFMRPITEPLKPMPWPFDRFELGQQRLGRAIAEGDRPAAILRLDGCDALVVAPGGAVLVDRASRQTKTPPAERRASSCFRGLEDPLRRP